MLFMNNKGIEHYQPRFTYKGGCPQSIINQGLHTKEAVPNFILRQPPTN